jgi:DNA-binding PadR family transcriptional regulator
MTNAELAVLSLIAEQPRHGYEIEHVIEERGMRDWTEVGFSSIYYLLKKLEKAGLIEGRIEQAAGRGPARKVYHITPAGQTAWQEATLDALSVPHRCYTPFQLGLANLPGISHDEALSALGRYRDGLAERREYVRARWARGDGEFPVHVDAMFGLSLTMIEAELEWVEGFLERLEEGNV